MKKNILIIFILLIVAGKANSQQCLNSIGCSNFEKQFPAEIITTESSTWQVVSTDMNAGNYTLFSVTEGNTYEWSYCSSHTGVELTWDAQLTLFNEADISTQLCFSTDACGLAPYISWSAPFTGTIRLLTTAYKGGEGCLSNSGSPFNKLVWRQLANVTAETYSLTITANNVNGTARSNAEVVLYNASNNELARVAANSSGKATFSSLSNETYHYEVYYTPTLTDVPVADNKEFWGSGTITISGSAVSEIFTRNEPYISVGPTFNPDNLNNGQQSSGSFTVKNTLPVPADSYIALWVDRNKVSAWDYSSNSPATAKSISIGGTSSFPFNITPTNDGTYSCYAFVYSKVNGTYMITDQYNWSQAFTVVTTISQIAWSGFTWKVKSGVGGPGPNNWMASSSNIWVDGQGNLHLKIIEIGNKWYCSEISLLQSLGYGEYTFEVSSNVENLDKNTVFGLFTYETDSREIDIEFSRWGNSSNVDGGYTIQPPPYNSMNQNSFALNLSGDYSTHQFKWNSTEIYFQSYHGHGLDNLINQWSYKGANNPPAGNEKLHLNFWLFRGNAPSNEQDAEVVIKSFKFESSLLNSSNEEFSDTNKIGLFPNPTKGLVNISLDQSIEGDFKIEVYNHIGLLMQSKNISFGNNTDQIDLSGYSNGIYLIKFDINNNSYFRKILKD